MCTRQAYEFRKRGVVEKASTSQPGVLEVMGRRGDAVSKRMPMKGHVLVSRSRKR